MKKSDLKYLIKEIVEAASSRLDELEKVDPEVLATFNSKIRAIADASRLKDPKNEVNRDTFLTLASQVYQNALGGKTRRSGDDIKKILSQNPEIKRIVDALEKRNEEPSGVNTLVITQLVAKANELATTVIRRMGTRRNIGTTPPW